MGLDKGDDSAGCCAVTVYAKSLTDTNSDGKDPATGRFLPGNRYGHGRPRGSVNSRVIHKMVLELVHRVLGADRAAEYVEALPPGAYAPILEEMLVRIRPKRRLPPMPDRADDVGPVVVTFSDGRVYSPGGDDAPVQDDDHDQEGEQ